MNKYHAKRTLGVNGIWFRSKLEAHYAQELELRRHAEDPKERVDWWISWFTNLYLRALKFGVIISAWSEVWNGGANFPRLHLGGLAIVTLIGVAVRCLWLVATVDNFMSVGRVRLRLRIIAALSVRGNRSALLYKCESQDSDRLDIRRGLTSPPLNLDSASGVMPAPLGEGGSVPLYAGDGQWTSGLFKGNHVHFVKCAPNPFLNIRGFFAL